MRTIDIEARGEAGQTGGSRVVLVLNGVAELPDPLEFYVRPAGMKRDDAELGLLLEPVIPLSTRYVEDGVEIVVGPEIASHPSLVAGSEASIEFPEARLTARVKWPSTEQQRSRRPRVHASKALASPRSAPSMAASPVAVTAPRPVSVPVAMPPIESAKVESAAPQPIERRKPDLVEAVERRPGPPADQRQAAAPIAEAFDFKPHLPPAATASARAPRRLGEMLSAATIGAALLLALQAVLWLAFVEPARRRAVAQVASTSPASIYELLQADAVSPRGVAGANVAPDEALERAQVALRGTESDRNAPEAAYWLRRYLQQLGTDVRSRRALTQLGSIAVEGGVSGPAYDQARLAWELAGSLGDPLALCFLGRLHMQGLGTPVDKRAALMWFERARLAGGCPGLEQSIARLK